MVAPHVPVADVSTAPLGPVDPATGAPNRSRALTAGLIAAVALLGIALIVFLTLYFQDDDEPIPALTPTPSSSPTVTTPPAEAPPTEEPPAEEPEEPEPEPEPTTPPDPTDPPDPDPTGTPAATAP